MLLGQILCLVCDLSLVLFLFDKYEQIGLNEYKVIQSLYTLMDTNSGFFIIIR